MYYKFKLSTLEDFSISGLYNRIEIFTLILTGREEHNEYALQKMIKEKYQFQDWPLSLYLQVVQYFHHESFL